MKQHKIEYIYNKLAIILPILVKSSQKTNKKPYLKIHFCNSFVIVA